jgi:hypothetical protein
MLIPINNVTYFIIRILESEPRINNLLLKPLLIYKELSASDFLTNLSQSGSLSLGKYGS